VWHPAVGIDRLRRGIRILVVPRHHVVAANHDFTGNACRLRCAGRRIDDAGFVAERGAGAAELAFGGIGRIGEAWRAGLGHAEGLDYADAEFGFERAQQLRRQRRARPNGKTSLARVGHARRRRAH
jgi:hypothetical protein